MAMKTIAISDLLRKTGGNSGIGGDGGCEASIDAGAVVPPMNYPAFPSATFNLNRGNTPASGGNTKTQYPCGCAELDPTVPTIPTKYKQDSGLESNHPGLGYGLAENYYKERVVI